MDLDDIVILGVIVDANMTFGMNLRIVSRAAAQRVLWENLGMDFTIDLFMRYFWNFALSMLEYCLAVSSGGLILSYWVWLLMLRWPLRRFPELQQRGTVSWESPGKYFMIGSCFWDLFGALSCRSSSIIQQCGDQLPIHTLNYWTELSAVLVF